MVLLTIHISLSLSLSLSLSSNLFLLSLFLLNGLFLLPLKCIFLSFYILSLSLSLSIPHFPPLLLYTLLSYSLFLSLKWPGFIPTLVRRSKYLGGLPLNL